MKAKIIDGISYKTIAIPRELHTRLKMQSAKEGISLGQIVLQAFNGYLVAKSNDKQN